MESLENLAIEELKMLAKVRSINGYKNIFRQQLESMFTIPSSNPTPKPKPRPKKRTSVPTPTPDPRPKKCTLVKALIPTPSPKKLKPTIAPKSNKPF